MADPTTTARVTPDGIPLRDGYSTQIAFSQDSNICFWEKTVTPPSVDGGDPIETTTMHNSTWRTLAPRSLKTLGEIALTAAYDPDLYDEAVAICNVEGSITVHFPDGSTLDFYGFLQSVEPQEHVEGDQPEANIVVVPTNWDPTNNVEAGPVMTEVAGT